MGERNGDGASCQPKQPAELTFGSFFPRQNHSKQPTKTQLLMRHTWFTIFAHSIDRNALKGHLFSPKHVPGGDHVAKRVLTAGKWPTHFALFFTTYLPYFRPFLSSTFDACQWRIYSTTLLDFHSIISLKLVTLAKSYLGNRPTSTGQDGKERWKQLSLLYTLGLLLHWLATRDVTYFSLPHRLEALYVTNLWRL